MGCTEKTILHILALSVFAGIFVKFAGTIGDGDLGETGFFVVFLLLFSLVLSGFLGVYAVAEKALENLIGFMKALIPSFSLTLCYGGKMQSSLAFYEAMLLAMGLLSMAMKYFLMPGVEIYFFPKRDQSDGRTPVLENGGFNWQYIKDVNSYFVCGNDWLSGNPGLVSSGNGPCEK